MNRDTISRREILRMTGGLLATPVLAACGATRGLAPERLTTPIPVPGDGLAPGCHPLGTGGERDGVVSVPAAAGPRPLIVMLHGAGGRALAYIVARCEVDRAHVALAGFSDGATYALALGRANGDRFTHLLAFSPGFLIPARPSGTPGILVSHGLADDVLPIDRCSRKLVPALRRQGYHVRYREFEGRHEVPPAIAREGLDWWLGAAAGSDPA
jgi:phospholipase/carboxylesterase